MKDTAGRCGRRRGGRRAGFTLMELMVVVTIVGVLAAIAYPSLQSYIYKSRCSEATAFLGQIKLHQEAFRSEFGQYVTSSAGPDISAIVHVPTPPTNGQTVPFSAASTPDEAAWQQLGARPDSAVRFGYGWASGPPPLPGLLGGASAPGQDMWFVAQAVGDVDADGTEITFEAYSNSTNIWFSNPRGWD